MYSHKISLTHKVAPKQKPYRVLPSKLQVVKEHVEEVLNKDIIEPSDSYGDPVVLIPKKHESKPRFFVDDRKVNAVILTSQCPWNIGLDSWSCDIHYFGPE